MYLKGSSSPFNVTYFVEVTTFWLKQKKKKIVEDLQQRFSQLNFARAL